MQALFLDHFDVLLYRTPTKLLIWDETLGIPFNFNFSCVGWNNSNSFPALPEAWVPANAGTHAESLFHTRLIAEAIHASAKQIYANEIGNQPTYVPGPYWYIRLKTFICKPTRLHATQETQPM